MSKCCWSRCEDEAEVAAVGQEGDERFILEVCRRHWRALAEQEEPWHLEERS